MPGCDLARARDESESVHFAHAGRHLFVWHGPYARINTYMTYQKRIRKADGNRDLIKLLYLLYIFG